MMAKQRRHFRQWMPIHLGALALAISSAPVPAATLFEEMLTRGDEYLAVASGGYTGEVLLFGVKSLTVYETVKVEGHAEEVVVSPADGCVYVTDREQSLIRVIDPSIAEVLGTVSLPNGTGLPHVAVSKDGEVIYIADELTGGIYRIHLRRRVYQVGSPTTPGSRFQSIALTNDGQRLLITDPGQARIVVVGTNPFGPLAYIPLNAGFPLRISISANDKFALVADELLGSVLVLDLAHSVISGKLPVKPGAVDMVITPDGKSAYVSVWPTRAVFQIDLETWRSKPMTNLPFPPGPLEVSPDGDYVLVTERLGALEHLSGRRRLVAVALVDARTGKIVRTGEFVGDPHAVRFLKPHLSNGHQQPACPAFRNGEWVRTSTDGLHHGGSIPCVTSEDHLGWRSTAR